MTLLHGQDQHELDTDTSIIINSEGRPRPIIPAAIRVSQALQQQRPSRSQVMSSQVMGPPSAITATTPNTAAITAPQPANGTPISMIKKMPPVTMAHLRLSQAQAALRPSAMGTIPQSLSSGQQSPTDTSTHSAITSTPLATSVSGGSPMKSPVTSFSENGVVSEIDGSHSAQEGTTAQSNTPARPKSQNKAVVIPNGYHMGNMNGYPAMANSATAAAYLAQHNLTAHQIQDMKSAFASMPADLSAMHSANRPTYPAHIVGGATNFNLPLGNANFNLKLPTSRQMQWATSGVRPNSAIGQMGGDTSIAVSGLGQGNGMAPMAMTPVRVPSGNGGLRSVAPAVAQMMSATGRASPAHLAHFASAHASLSPHMHATSPVPGAMIVQPPRPVASPIPPSPSLTQQPLVQNGAGVGGY
jgi:enhancer of polycomb-like protein